MAGSPTAPVLATVAGRTVRLWDAASGECLHRFPAFRRDPGGLAFSADGSLVAAGSREGRVRVWEVASGREKADLDWKCGRVRDIAFSPNGSTAAAGCGKGVVVWDLD